MQKGNFIYKLNFVITIIIATIAFTPFLNRNVPEITNVALLVLWSCTAILGGFRFDNKVSKWWLLFLLYQALTVIVGHSNVSINTIIARAPIYCTPVLITYIVNNYSFKSRRNMQSLLLLVLLYNVISNVIIGAQNPEIFNTLNVVDKNDSDLLTNAGSTSFVAICLFTIPLCWLCNKYGDNRLFKRISLLLLVASTYFMVFVNSRATALLLLIIIILGFIVPFNHSDENRKRRKRPLLIILVLVALYYGTIPLLEFLASFFSNMDGMAGRISTRMIDIIQFIELSGDVGAMDDGSFLKRLLLWQTSLNTFTNSLFNFLFGIGEDTHLYDYYSLLSCGVGCHSTILDCLAQYGIIGGFFIFMCFKSSFDFIRNQTNNVIIKKRFEIVSIVFVIYSILNISLTSDLLFIYFFLFPLTFSCIKKNEKCIV